LVLMPLVNMLLVPVGHPVPREMIEISGWKDTSLI
jgi:hypothetical protein